jgi:hypothetical protein
MEVGSVLMSYFMFSKSVIPAFIIAHNNVSVVFYKYDAWLLMINLAITV